MESYSIRLFFSFASHTVSVICLCYCLCRYFLFYCWIVSIVWIRTMCLSIPLLMNLNCFQFMASIVKAPVNICVQSLCRRLFSFFWVYIQEWNCRLIGQMYIELYKELANSFPVALDLSEFQLLHILVNIWYC